jgi:hypothetical protein
VDVHVPSDAE